MWVKVNTLSGLESIRLALPEYEWNFFINHFPKINLNYLYIMYFILFVKQLGKNKFMAYPGQLFV